MGTIKGTEAQEGLDVHSCSDFEVPRVALANSCLLSGSPCERSPDPEPSRGGVNEDLSAAKGVILDLCHLEQLPKGVCAFRDPQVEKALLNSGIR